MRIAYRRSRCMSAWPHNHWWITMLVVRFYTTRILAFARLVSVLWSCRQTPTRPHKPLNWLLWGPTGCTCRVYLSRKLKRNFGAQIHKYGNPWPTFLATTASIQPGYHGYFLGVNTSAILPGVKVALVLGSKNRSRTLSIGSPLASLNLVSSTVIV
jgi:hypothetical protein